MKWYIETAEVVRYGVTGIPIIIRQRDRGDGSVIVDTLNNSSLYRGLSPRIALAFDYLCGSDLRDAAAGTFEIDGTRVYAIIQDYISLPLLQGAWEAHRHYIDLQYVIAGWRPAPTIRRETCCPSPGRAISSLSGRETSCSFSRRTRTCRESRSGLQPRSGKLSSR
jgi:hypothetical protein